MLHADRDWRESGRNTEVPGSYGPIIDARKGMVAAFDGLPEGTEPRLFKLKGCKQFDDGCVWMTYIPKK